MYYKNLFKNNTLLFILLLVLLSTSSHLADASCEHMTLQISQNRTGSGESARKDDPYQDLVTHGNILKIQDLNENRACKTELQDLHDETQQKIETLRNDPDFQEMSAELLQPISKSLAAEDPRKESKSELYVFVSFPMGEKALLNLAREAKPFGATFVLRGFFDGSYLKTAKAFQKIIAETDQRVLIDPELYTLFNVTAVPTFVLAKPFQLYAQERIQTPLHDQLQGHVSAHYAVEQFAEKGDLRREAQILVERITAP